MSNRTKAGFITAGILGLGALTMYALQLISEYVTPEQFYHAFMFSIMAALVYGMYQVILARLDYEQGLDKLNESIKK